MDTPQPRPHAAPSETTRLKHWGKSLTELLIAPRQLNEDSRNREIILNILLLGTLAILLSVTSILMINLFAADYRIYAAVVGRITWSVTALIVLGFVYLLSRLGKFRVAASLLAGLYYVLATLVLHTGGVNTPFGILFFALVIVLSGILLSARYSLFAAGLTVVTMFGLKYSEEHGTSFIVSPAGPTSLADIIGYSVLFGVIALVSWLFNREMERSLHQALRAELALKRQKLLLEVKVEQRTRELQAAQLEKVQQLYRFAELGQLSTGLLHDLANHLTVLTLDINDLEGTTHSTKTLRHARKSLQYLDNAIQRVRDQLLGESQNATVNVSAEVTDLMGILARKAQRARVDLQWQPPEQVRNFRCKGDPVRFRQLAANIIGNAIDAYAEATTENRTVLIRLEQKNDERLELHVKDWGRGIPKKQREKIFEPFFSTKEQSMGLGLFIARQIARDHFGGDIRLRATTASTEFIIILSKK